MKNLITAFSKMGRSLLQLFVSTIVLSFLFTFMLSKFYNVEMQSIKTLYAFDVQLSKYQLSKIHNWYTSNNNPVEIISNNFEVDKEFSTWNSYKKHYKNDKYFKYQERLIFNIIILERNNNPLASSLISPPWKSLSLQKHVMGPGGPLVYDISYSKSFITISLFILPLVLFLVAFFSRKKLNVASGIAINKVKIFLVILITLVLFYIESGILYFLNENNDDHFDYYEVYNFNNYIFPLFAVVIAPLCEEMFFRWFLLEMFIQRNLQSLGLIVTTFSFTGLHGVSGDNYFDLIRLSMIFISGLVAGLIYVYSRRLIYPVIFHSGFNLLYILHLYS